MTVTKKDLQQLIKQQQKRIDELSKIVGASKEKYVGAYLKETEGEKEKLRLLRADFANKTKMGHTNLEGLKKDIDSLAGELREGKKEAESKYIKEICLEKDELFKLQNSVRFNRNRLKNY